MSQALLNFVKSVCVQYAWYWANQGNTGYGGISYADPVRVSCRWDGKVQLVKDPTGKEVISSAEVLVLQEMTIDGLLLLTDPDNTTPPPNSNGAVPIIQKVTVPLFKSTDLFVRTVYV